VKWWAIVGSNH